ncbi:MAG: universal stress protein [Rhodopirellula sp.]|nr:universal stress protein [Rhodopirellula sp.]
MERSLFHIYQDNPNGRETLLQSIDFCRKLGGLKLTIYQPEETSCLMYLEQGEVITIDLNENYTKWTESATLHINALMHDAEVEFEQFVPQSWTRDTLPNLPGEWAIMTCPRSMSEPSAHFGIGRIHSKVRSIARHAPFPVLIPAPCFKPWNRVAAFYGGAEFGVHVVRLALCIADRANVPLTLFTQLDGLSGLEIEEELRKANLLHRFSAEDNWTIFDTGAFEENLFDLQHDALVVIGAADHNAVEDLIFGSRLETIQRTLPNPILVVGPECRESL